MNRLAAICFLLTASFARAQQVSLRVAAAPGAVAASSVISAAAAPLAMTAAPALAAPAAVLAAPALASPALAAAPSVEASIPALAAALPAAASTPERGAASGAARSAAALTEFSRLVAELMSGDKAKSDAAAEELNGIKEAHLNGDPQLRTIKVLDPKPMQIPVGMYEVEDKQKKLSGMKAEKADKWLREKSLPVVEDWKGRTRPVDHHHELRAAWAAGFAGVYAHDYFDDALHGLIKGLSKEEFYAVTRAMGLYYDRDERGAVQDPSALPEDTRGHTDDPYRSLAGSVRDAGGYDKTSEPFAEFQWAQFFRGRVTIGASRDDFDKAVAEAMKLVHDPAAKGLPGYRPD